MRISRRRFLFQSKFHSNIQTRSGVIESENGAFEPVSGRVNSWSLARVFDGLFVLGIAALLCGLGGIGDDNTDSLIFSAIGVALLALAFAARGRVRRPSYPTPRQILFGLGTLWLVFVAIGAALYLATGSLTRPDDAVVEAAAGFTTTAVTVLDHASVSRSTLLWRAATSWIGGLTALEMAVVALPSALGSTALLGYTSIRRGRDLAPNTRVGMQRVMAVYSGMTAFCIMGYLSVGLEFDEAVIVGLGTVSTGGFSPRPDSMAGYGTGAMVVATVGMLLAGFSIFVLWWMLHGRARPLLRSQELRIYSLMVALLTAASVVVGDADLGEALFTAASVTSTTGYAVSDWTAWPAAVTTALLVSASIGPMLGSIGGGMQILRIRLLLGYARRELQRQLRPRAILVVRRDGRAVDEATLERVSSYQIANLTLITFGAIALGITGLSITGSLWTSISSLSTLGPRRR